MIRTLAQALVAVMLILIVIAEAQRLDDAAADKAERAAYAARQ